MAKKFDFLSPGIEMREVDQSFIPGERDAEGPIIIGRTRKGPANKPVKIRNLDDFVSVFGAPVPGGTGDQGDIWREGNTTGPTYASYAAQAWLASEESPVVVVRLAGEQHPNASAGYAGWKLDATPSATISSNGTAYGLFLVNSGSTDFGTGSLAAVLYANEGYITLTGSHHVSGSMGSQTINEAGTFIKSVGAGRAFKFNIYNSAGTLLETPVVNFSRNSSKYIRNVLNTNPQLTNSTVIDSADLKTYWLGESYVRNVEDTVTNTAAGTVYGILLPLESGSLSDNNWSDRNESAKEAKSGWVISQKATNQVKLFRLKAMSVGNETQRNYMIAVESIKEPTNSNVESYGSFTVAVKDMSGMAVERFSNVNLNPASPNYIGKRIGDQYMTWDNSNRRYRTYGDYPNQSDLIYVDINQNIADGGGAGLLPAGFYGPVRPKGFTLAYGHNTAQAFGDGGPSGTKAAIVITVAGGELVENDVFTVTLAGDAYQVTVGSTSVTSATSFTDGGVAASPRYTAIIKAETDDGGTPTGDDLQELFNSVDGYTATDNNSGVVTITADKAGAFWDISYAETTDANSRISAATPTAGTGSDGFLGAFVKGNNTCPAMGGTSTVFAAGPLHYTASFNFPKIPLRDAGTDGAAPDPYRVYYGIRPKLSTTSTTNDPDYVDYVRSLNAGADAHTPTNDDHFEYSFIFTLDDLVVNSDENTVTYTSGSWSATANTSTTSFTSPQNAQTNQNGTFGELLDLNVRQFLMPIWGGTEGFDITEKEPLRNDGIGSSLAETTNYVQYTLLKAIDSIKDPEVVPGNLLMAPGIYEPLITNKLISIAEDRKDVLAVIDLENDYVPTAESKDTAANRLGSVTSAVSSLKSRNLNSSYACCFYPWVQVADNISGGQYVWIPSSVAGLGAMAKSQAQSEVWFAPAGFNRGGLGNLGGRRGPPVISARQRLDSNERDSLYEVNINPIATFPAEGVVIFGQKTLQAGQSALDRINVRRLLLYLKSKVSTVARNLLFDQNVDSTWARFKSQVNPVLAGTQARFGLTDYKLVLDETTTTADLIDRNVMYAKIYIKPARAIEYIVVDFVITRTGAEFV